MNEPIISRASIRACARDDFAKGAGRDDHNMNPGSAAIDDWQAEWDLCNMRRLQAQRRATSGQVCTGTPP